MTALLKCLRAAAVDLEVEVVAVLVLVLVGVSEDTADPVTEHVQCSLSL